MKVITPSELRANVTVSRLIRLARFRACGRTRLWYSAVVYNPSCRIRTRHSRSVHGVSSAGVARQCTVVPSEREIFSPIFPAPRNAIHVSAQGAGSVCARKCTLCWASYQVLGTERSLPSRVLCLSKLGEIFRCRLRSLTSSSLAVHSPV